MTVPCLRSPKQLARLRWRDKAASVPAFIVRGRRPNECHPVRQLRPCQRSLGRLELRCQRGLQLLCHLDSLPRKVLGLLEFSLGPHDSLPRKGLGLLDLLLCKGGLGVGVNCGGLLLSLKLLDRANSLRRDVSSQRTTSAAPSTMPAASSVASRSTRSPPPSTESFAAPRGAGFQKYTG